jgi:hypothetical protein
MSKYSIIILYSIILLAGCFPINEKSETDKNEVEKVVTDTMKKAEKKVKKFKITKESMVGNWHTLVTQNKNPEYYNKILLTGNDYISFYPNGVIEERKDLANSIDVRTGKYSIDTSNNEITIKYNQLHHKWKQLSPGKAVEFYWINTEMDFEKNLNNYYIKRGSKEWDKYAKRRIDMDKIRDIVNSVDALELEKGYKYKISKKTPLMSSYSYSGSIDPTYLNAGTNIEILSRTEIEGTIWYKAYVPTSNKTGWINSIALFGQSIKKVTD